MKDNPQLSEPQRPGTSKLDWRHLEHNKIDRNELQVRKSLHKGTGTKMTEKLNNLTEKNRSFLFLCLYANFCEPWVHFYQLYCVQSTSRPILKSLVPVVHFGKLGVSLHKSDTVLLWEESKCPVSFALPKRPINQLDPVQQIIQQELKDSCPNKYHILTTTLTAYHYTLFIAINLGWRKKNILCSNLPIHFGAKYISKLPTFKFLLFIFC